MTNCGRAEVRKGERSRKKGKKSEKTCGGQMDEAAKDMTVTRRFPESKFVLCFQGKWF